MSFSLTLRFIFLNFLNYLIISRSTVTMSLRNKVLRDWRPFCRSEKQSLHLDTIIKVRHVWQSERQLYHKVWQNNWRTTGKVKFAAGFRLVEIGICFGLINHKSAETPKNSGIQCCNVVGGRVKHENLVLSYELIKPLQMFSWWSNYHREKFGKRTFRALAFVRVNEEVWVVVGFMRVWKIQCCTPFVLNSC